nr:reverse transcriptase N-terminal domain-containing protein [Escherichia coli]
MSTHCRVSSATHGSHWHLINWRYCHRRVKKLQLRIAKATQEQQWRKVKALQRMLTRSFSAKALAVKRVTENTGRKTPGGMAKYGNIPNPSGPLLPGSNGVDTTHSRCDEFIFPRQTGNSGHWEFRRCWTGQCRHYI